jgi:hypothetical protein
MTRKTEIEDILKPWYQPPDVNYDTMSPVEFDKMLAHARQITVLSARWYFAGLQRAIDEMDRTVDGKHLYSTRAELISHLKSIHAPH